VCVETIEVKTIVGNMRNFKEQMKDRGWWGVRNDASNQPARVATHLCLDGGKLCVPDEHSGTFLNVYFNAILRGETPSVVEVRTRVFKMFLDIDARVYNEDEDFEEVLACISTKARGFWPTSASEMIVCTAPVKRQGEWFKRGFHVYFPAIYVTTHIALAFRDALLLDLHQHHSKGPCTNTWEEAIDPAVYKSSGLRMLYSGKGPKEQRQYTPLVIFQLDGTRERLGENLPAGRKRELLISCSIRTFGEERPTSCVADSLQENARDHKIGAAAVLGKSTTLEAYAKTLPEVQAALPSIYTDQKFTGVFKTDHAVMLRSSSRYCMNVQREHATSTVYFCVTRRGICQKCYCRKEGYGCDTYASEYFELEPRIIASLVPPLPDFIEETVAKVPSKRRGGLENLLVHSRFVKKRTKPRSHKNK
jgi:hypothetical protein